MRPASFCGVVGFKPTFRRISREGVIPLAPSFDHVGFFTRDVAGADLAAAVLCAEWRTDTDRASRPVLAIPAGPYLARASSVMLEHFQAACRRLAVAGYGLKTINVMRDFDAIYARHFLIANAELARVHRKWFPRFREAYHPKTAEKLEIGRTVSSSALDQARRDCDAFRATVPALMRQHGIDLWIAPAATGAAPVGLESTGDPVMNLPWTQLGLPVLALPSGHHANGLPLGVQLAAQPDQDEQLLRWGAELETTLHAQG